MKQRKHTVALPPVKVYNLDKITPGSIVAHSSGMMCPAEPALVERIQSSTDSKCAYVYYRLFDHSGNPAHQRCALVGPGEYAPYSVISDNVINA